MTRWARVCAGPVSVTWQGGKVTKARFAQGKGPAVTALGRQLEQVLSTGRVPAYLSFSTRGLPEFTRRCLRVCGSVKRGSTMTYSELAAAAGRPRAARAAGQAMARNPFPLLIPCHRVVGKEGRLTGFGGGLAMKRALLAAEGWSFAETGKRTRVVRQARDERRK